MLTPYNNFYLFVCSFTYLLTLALVALGNCWLNFYLGYMASERCLPHQNCTLKVEVVNSTGCTCRGPMFGSQHPYQMTHTTSKVSSGGFDAVISTKGISFYF